jgi:hypothetical protein
MKETQKPFLVGEAVAFRAGGTLGIAEDGYNGNILRAAFKALEKETAGLIHGTATLTLHVKDGHLLRYVTSRERSHVPGRPMTGCQ